MDPETHEATFLAMGTAAQVIVTATSVGTAGELVAVGRTRIEALEGLWSRFLPESELSTLNRSDGWVRVSHSTGELLDKAVAARDFTAGRFDPFILDALEQLGYDRSFDKLGAASSESATLRRPLPPATVNAGIERHGATVRRLGRERFDPGGIAKGLAADLVSAELMAAGATGVMVNLGGDLRVRGLSPSGRQIWPIAIVEKALQFKPLAIVHLIDCGLATSTPLRRRWGRDRHHLIDPFTGSSAAGPDVVSAIAGEAWWAEAAATAMSIDDSLRLPGVAALVARGDGIRRSNRFGEFEVGVAA